MEEEKWQGGKGREGALIDFRFLAEREVYEVFQTGLAAFGTNNAIALWRAGENSDKDTV